MTERFILPSLVLSLGLAGCGDDGKSGRLADAPPTQDAAIQTVVLTVSNLGGPQSGVRVYFLGPDDALIASAETDSSGHAKADMPSGGSVTAIDPFPVPLGTGSGSGSGASNGNELRTFLGVKPGDHLYLTGNPAAVNVTLDAPAHQGASSYQVRSTCGSAPILSGNGSQGSASRDPGGPLTLIGCNGTADLMVVAYPPESGTPAGTLYRPGVALSEGGHIDLTKDSYQPLVDMTFSYTGVPDGVPSLELAYALATSRGVLDPGARASVGVDGGTAMTTLGEPAFSDTLGIVVTTAFLQAQHQVIDWGAPATRYTLDLGSALLPDILATPPQFDLATRQLSWTEAKAVTGSAPDLATARLSITRPAAARIWHWEIAGPHAAAALKLPGLPADLFDWSPGAGDSVATDTVLTARLSGGYDAVRPRIFDVRDGHLSAGAFAGAVGGSSGRAVTAEFQLPQPGVR